MKRFLLLSVIVGTLPLASAVCDPGTEPALVTLPMVADGSGLAACTSDLGYEVELRALRVAIRDLELTVGGETHSSLRRGLQRMILATAFAHPGHYAGGDVTGELPGRFIINPFSGNDRPLGDATLLEGDYQGMNFTFRRAALSDDIEPDDPLLGHTVALSGIARRDEEELSFDALLDIAEDIQVVGAPFSLEARPNATATLVFRLLLVDPSTEEDTLFDGVDFFAIFEMSDDNTLQIEPGDDAHNILRRRLQVHDHWWLEPRD